MKHVDDMKIKRIAFLVDARFSSQRRFSEFLKLIITRVPVCPPPPPVSILPLHAGGEGRRYVVSMAIPHYYNDDRRDKSLRDNSSDGSNFAIQTRCY